MQNKHNSKEVYLVNCMRHFFNSKVQEATKDSRINNSPTGTNRINTRHLKHLGPPPMLIYLTQPYT